jgi:DNA-binding transcriptional LysR family regulator
LKIETFCFLNSNFLNYHDPMNLANLETFLKIVETGSLVRASEALNVTQSTVTARLKALEDELGQTLLVRQKSGATLTAAGLKLKRYAQVMSGLWRQARMEISLPKGTRSVCNLGCHQDLWHGLGKTLFEALRARHPEDAISLWTGEQSELDARLGAGLVDVAITYQPVVHGNQSIQLLPPDELVLYALRPDNPIRSDPDYIYVDLGEDFHRGHSHEYADAGVARTSFSSAVWALEHLLETGGSAYLPERLARPHEEAGRLHRIQGAPAYSRNTYLVTNDRTISNWPVLQTLDNDVLRAG